LQIPVFRIPEVGRAAAVAAVGAVPLLLALSVHGAAHLVLLILGGVAVAIACAVVIWYIDPVYTITAGLALYTFEGNWQALGVPVYLELNRLLLVLGTLMVAMRAPGCVDRPRINTRSLHLMLIVVIAYVLVAAAWAGTLTDKDALFAIAERIGIVPFVVFYIAPVVFRTHRQRMVLLTMLVGVGAYYGLTALFETLGAKSLVWPSYILDPQYGFQAGRARGPFAESVVFGAALLLSAIASGVALVMWRRTWARAAAATVLTLDVLGCFFTLTRSVWLGAAVGLLVFLLAMPSLRRYLLLGTAVGALVLALSIAYVPGLSSKVSVRAGDQRTLWDRKNLNVAAINMVEAKPLTGVGWARFDVKSPDYAELSPDYPLTAVTTVFVVHNVWLQYGAELGLPGIALIMGTLLFAIAGALGSRTSPDSRPWLALALGYTACYAVISNFTFPQPYVPLMLWAVLGASWALRPDAAYAPAAVLPSHDWPATSTEASALS
jgi:O-antigen ligase